MSINSVADIVKAFDAGRFRLSVPVRKTVAGGVITTATGLWYDSTILAGVPSASYFASTPLAFAPMARSTHGGWDHGNDFPGFSKYLKRVDFCMGYLSANTGSLSGLIHDILGYYPFFEEDPGVDMLCDNSVALAPRHGTGAGVQAYALCVAPSQGGAGNTITITYQNSDGVSGRVSRAQPIAGNVAAAINGAVLSSGDGLGPWFHLQGSDSGIRRIESVRLNGPGDTGLFTVVLARPVAPLPTFIGKGNNEVVTQGLSFAEHDYLRTHPRLPAIADDAFISALVWPTLYDQAATALRNFSAHFDVVWG